MVVCIYGASGWTGHQVANALSALGIPLVLAGRSIERTNEVASRLEARTPCRPATLDDPRSLDHALRGSRVVVNCAGPYVETGPPILDAALRNGVAYVDMSGEMNHIAEVYERWSERAARLGITVCPALAAKGALGDWSAHAIRRLLDEVVPETLTVAYAHALRQFFRPSTASALSAAAQGFLDAAVPREERALDLHFPPPFGFGRALRVPGSEEITIPLHLPIRSVRTYISVDPGGRGNGPWAQALLGGYRWLPLFGRVMMSEWGRFHTRVYFPPPERDHEPDTFGAVVTGTAGERSATIGLVTNDAYSVSAAIVALAVPALLRASRLPAGVCSPAQLIDPFAALDALRGSGMLRILRYDQG